MLQFENVSKSFGETIAIDSVSLDCQPGKTVALIGPSGCGKTTLLRLAIGLCEPDEGEVQFDGEKLEFKRLNLARHRMGYVIQEGGLFPHLNVEENVCLAARQVGKSNAECLDRLKVLTELCQLPSDILGRYPSELSGGQRQRVALIRALMLDPEVLLLDEPLGALDPIIRRELQLQLRNIFSRLEKTVLLVTHDMGEAAYLAERIVLLNEGTVVQDGSLEDLLSAPASPFVSEFISAQRNLLDSNSEGSHV